MNNDGLKSDFIMPPFKVIDKVDFYSVDHSGLRLKKDLIFE